MIYDCFGFFNEMELLELRLNELAGVVDKFVLVESTKTHSNQPKPLYFQENRSRFSAFQDKIIHVIVNDLPDSSDSMWLDRYQRNCIARGLVNCRPDDWVLISDLDEIPRAEVVARIAREFKFPHGIWPDLIVRPVIRSFTKWSFTRGRAERSHPYIFKFEHSLHRHYINCVTVAPPELVHWHGTRMVYYRDILTPQNIRHAGHKIVKNGGWHFTAMGGVARIQQKIKAFAHQEFNHGQYTDPNYIEKSIVEGKSLFDPNEQLRFMPLDNSYPRYFLEHPERFPGWVKPV